MPRSSDFPRPCCLARARTTRPSRPRPADTYLTRGSSGPRAPPLGSMEDEENDGAPSNEDGETDAGVPGYRTVRPCSIGLTFASDSDAAVVVSLASTARYVPEEKESPEGGRPERHWRRLQLDYSYEIPAGDAGAWSTQKFRDRDGAAVADAELRLHIKRRIDGHRQVVTATLINEAVESDDRLRDQCCLFQTGLEARAVDREGAGAIWPRAAVPSGAEDEDTRSASLLYRDIVEYAVGHGVAAMWRSSPTMRVDRVATAWLPTARVKGTSADPHVMLKERLLCDHPEAFGGVVARADRRASRGRGRSQDICRRVRSLDPGNARSAARGHSGKKCAMPPELNLARCQETCRRMGDGRSCAGTGRQRVAGIRARERRDGSAGVLQSER